MNTVRCNATDEAAPETAATSMRLATVATKAIWNPVLALPKYLACRMPS